ncbi:hypothetical protein [Humisphaera borealis]|uniref:DUF1080 domain-containing protein n=1 Tax=Humisphaera borealis TaxID=2807512 RepID=A0A7M2WX93_9BACT|nr:hypothetical protein [Humisphaera borealis]QOV89130.1 hypothetical protein IPV69_23395 [Humisphaera borealis]
MKRTYTGVVRVFVSVLCIGVLSSQTLTAADKAEKPTDKAAEKTVKFPAPVVNQILKGWNGVDWGTPLDKFKTKFPKAAQGPTGRWTTGNGNETLAGVAGNVLYGFNKKGEFNAVTFEPVEAERTLLRDKLIDAGVLREAVKPNWQNSGVSFICVETNDGQIAVILHAKYADPKEKKT